MSTTIIAHQSSSVCENNPLMVSAINLFSFRPS
jgi:hypothetical protein